MTNDTYNIEFKKRYPKLCTTIDISLSPELAKQVLTCSNFAKEFNEKNKDDIVHHQLLATLGDAVLYAIVAKTLYDEKSDVLTSENLSKKRQALITNRMLQEIGKKLLNGVEFFHSNGEMEGNKSYATALEAVFGAIYADKGYMVCDSFWKKLRTDLNFEIIGRK